MFGSQSTNPQVQGAVNFSGPVIKGVNERFKPSELDKVTLIDATGSSGGFSTGIQRIAMIMASELPKHIGQVSFGLHICRDLDYDKDADFSIGDHLSPDDFVKNTQRIVFEGGGDAEETQLDSCLTISRTYPWSFSKFARRAIVVMSSSGSKHTRDGMDAKQVAQELSSQGIKVIVVAPSGVNLHELAVGTGGDSINLSNSPSQAELDRAIALLTRSLTQVATAGGGTLAIPANKGFGVRGTQEI